MFLYNNYQYEARWARAYFYFTLVRQYGGVPFKNHNTTGTEETALPRTSSDDIFNFIIKECDDIKDKIIEDYMQENGIEIVDVKQGYTRCSTAGIGKNSAITADSTIYNALTKNGIDVLKIDSGSVRLDGYDYGFIGGACTMIDDGTVAFFGDIKTHPNFRKIERFCIIHNVKIINLAEDKPLTDVGGAVKI
jgi:hypothetical protein